MVEQQPSGGNDAEVSICEDCGKPNTFPGSLKGTIQNCQYCGEYIDVGELQWDDDFGVPEDDMDPRVAEVDRSLQHNEDEAISPADSNHVEFEDEEEPNEIRPLFSWLRSQPSCPVDVPTKTWIENRFQWLTDELGLERLQRGRTVLPTKEFLPLRYEFTAEGIAELMVLVARYMDVEPSRLDLCFYEDDSPQFWGAPSSRTAGIYTSSGDRFEIWLEVNTLRDPAHVVATLAHEIGHVILLGQNRLSPDQEDQEEITDLLTVFLGLGIFTANSVIGEVNWRFGTSYAWSISKRGYLTMEMFGYAMALYTLARREPRPKWAKHLRLDVRTALKRGVEYILETRDCSFTYAFGQH